MDSMLKSGMLKKQIITRINKLVDIPFLDEGMEATFIAMGVDACFKALLAGKGGTRAIAVEGEEEEHEGLERAMPDEVDDPEEEEANKVKMVEEINQNFDVPCMNEEQEAKLIRGFVDALFASRKNGGEEE